MEKWTLFVIYTMKCFEKTALAMNVISSDSMYRAKSQQITSKYYTGARQKGMTLGYKRIC